MIERLAVDANAVIAWLRANATDPPPLRGAKAIIVPLPVVGELYTGAFSSTRRDENLRAELSALVGGWHDYDRFIPFDEWLSIAHEHALKLAAGDPR